MNTINTQHLIQFIIQDNIKKRNKYDEAKSPLFKDGKFLETMEDVYKNNFLKDISSHAELLVYDWSNGGEIELVVEDIERIGMSSSFELFYKEPFYLSTFAKNFQILIVSKENHRKCKIGASLDLKRIGQKRELNTPTKLVSHILSATYRYSIVPILLYNQKTLPLKIEFMKR